MLSSNPLWLGPARSAAPEIPTSAWHGDFPPAVGACF
jgi:hypothetical protein